MQRFERLRRGVLLSKIGIVKNASPTDVTQEESRLCPLLLAGLVLKPNPETWRPANLPATGKRGVTGLVEQAFSPGHELQPNNVHSKSRLS